MVLLPKEHLNSVVAIGLDTDKDNKWFATGFFYGYLREILDDNKGSYSIYLVTNKHVIKNAIDSGHSEILIKLNPKDGGSAKEYPLSLYDHDGTYSFVDHPDKYVDIAILPFDYVNFIKEIDASYIPSNQALSTEDLKGKVGEGDSIFVLGFPMGNVCIKRNTAIVRGGCIARISDLLLKENNEFLLDALIFPGNSGGPVFLKPQGIALEGTTIMNQAYLIGIVKEYIPYYDEAYSQQTQSLRVIFEDNSGLASAHPIDYIDQTILVHINGESKK